MNSPVDSIVDKVIISNFTSNNNFSKKTSDVTPMKTLIAQEMSKELESKHHPPNLVAKLMGLDSLPHQQTEIGTQRNRSHSDIPAGYWEKKNGVSRCPKECRDIFEVWPQSQIFSPRMGGHRETADEKKMAFVRQKFVEVKLLSMDEKHRESKKFHDALKVLSCNKDLFLKCLQEPNSVFSHSMPTTETKRITILRPSRVADEATRPLKTSKENPVQPTRIVVLKPSAVKATEDLFADVDNDENQESRDVARAITEQVREKLGRHHRDETLMSSAFSNGCYLGEDSSFNKSEFEFDGNNMSDEAEGASPASRHTWDYVNDGVCSPYTASSYSPESSSVCREARKRLSERLATVASNRIFCQEPKHERRSSSTLGEMLGKKMGNNPTKESSSIGEFNYQTPNVSVSEQKRDEWVVGNNPPRSLTRSKSAGANECKSTAQADETKTAKALSLKGKVSSLFFSRSKKANGDKSLAIESKDVPRPPMEDVSNDGNETVRNVGLNDELLLSKASFVNFLEKQGLLPPPENESTLLSKRIKLGVLGEKQDLPSSMSVLDPPDERAIKGVLHGNGPKLIGRSPPIGCIARTLSWDDSCNDTASSSKGTSTTTTTNDEDEQEWFLFVKTLLLFVANPQESNSTQWHSPVSPLDPSLRDNKYPHEAKSRHKASSTRKLIFDCVNDALADNERFPGERQLLVDEVWENMRPWFSYEPKRCPDEDNLLAVERLVRREAVGKVDGGGLRSEIDWLGNEIERELMEELVQETVVIVY